MNSFGQRPPIYLVVDLAGPESEHRKLRLVNDILDELSAEAHANGIGSDDHVTVVLFAEAGAPPSLSSSPYIRTAPPPPWRHTHLDENHRRLRGWCRSTPAT